MTHSSACGCALCKWACEQRRGNLVLLGPAQAARSERARRRMVAREGSGPLAAGWERYLPMDGGPGPASYLHVASGRVQTERPQTLDGWMPEVTLSANIYITLEEALAG
jgi:hypothetical protein